MSEQTRMELETLLDNVFSNLEVGEAGLLFDDKTHREVIRAALLQWEARIVAEAEARVISIAHRQPCDCGSTDHLPTPVRSVQGNVTYYCQFSRMEPSAALKAEQEKS